MFLSATIISAHKPEHDVRYLNCDSVTMNRCFFSLFIDCHWLLRCLNCTQLFPAQREWRKKTEALHCMAEHEKRETIRSDYCYGSILQLSFAFQWMKIERERKTRTNDFYSFSLDCQQKRCLWRVLCETHWCRLNAVFFCFQHTANTHMKS